ncbi:hypothetical protein ODU75_05440 [Lactobacillus amylovorus]|uniref:Uncharacterized protein n=1 Tax=Lactobacillus amylovorus TaxID=1604 RepID=A0A9X3W496_LACAM|nr:hypothetical protein [Lactobacillus amylovorus]MDB6257311.1 hypothetical protein [Lactobacillus amylovorus]MDB6263147.1 hypothetical protein [Lactobacillus amylovorus]MDB6266124.1 hypothetical protein [Lactobacillus amylovorus]
MLLVVNDSVSPDLIKYLESENNSFVDQVDRYLQSFLQFLLISILTTFLLVLTVWGLSRVAKYWKADLVKSNELQHSLLVETKIGMRNVESKANRIVKGSVVYFRRNQVVLKVPTKGWWQLWTQIEVQREIKARISTPEFKEWLTTHYGGYRFGDLIAHDKYYELIGEAY